MDVEHAGRAVLYMANLPLDANVLFSMTVMATKVPFVGRPGARRYRSACKGVALATASASAAATAAEASTIPIPHVAVVQ